MEGDSRVILGVLFSCLAAINHTNLSFVGALWYKGWTFYQIVTCWIAFVGLNWLQYLIIGIMVLIRKENQPPRLIGGLVRTMQGDVCPICLETLEETAFQTQCRHRFHSQCLHQCAKHHHTQCPVCRTTMVA